MQCRARILSSDQDLLFTAPRTNNIIKNSEEEENAGFNIKAKRLMIYGNFIYSTMAGNSFQEFYYVLNFL
jgi:hypothetical protein